MPGRLQTNRQLQRHEPAEPPQKEHQRRVVEGRGKPGRGRPDRDAQPKGNHQSPGKGGPGQSVPRQLSRRRGVARKTKEDQSFQATGADQGRNMDDRQSQDDPSVPDRPQDPGQHPKLGEAAEDLESSSGDTSGGAVRIEESSADAGHIVLRSAVTDGGLTQVRLVTEAGI